MFATNEAHATLTTATQDGFKVTWTLMGQPNDARMISACPYLDGDRVPSVFGYIYSIYALYKPVTGSQELRLFRSNDEGKTWTFVRTMPGNVTSMACSGPYSDNSPRRLSVFTSTTGSIAVYYGANLENRFVPFTDKSNLKAIQSAPYYEFVELDTAAAGGGIRSTDVYSKTSDSWNAVAKSAAMVTVGAGTPQPVNYGYRGFARNETSNYLYYNDLGYGTEHVWKRITSVATTDYLDQITAVSSTVLFALQSNPATPNARKLYRAKFTEVSCTDGLDNDEDSLFDNADPDCQ